MSDQNGGAGVLITICILIVGLAAGIYLVSQRTNFLPRASSGQSETSINLTPLPPNKDDGTIRTLPDEKFSLNLTLRSNVEPVKRVNVKLRYPHNLVKIDSIDASLFGTLPVEWQVREYDNLSGTSTIMAIIPGDGFKNSSTEPALIARLNFVTKPLTSGNIGKIEFLQQGTGLVSAKGDLIENVIERDIEIQVGLAAQ